MEPQHAYAANPDYAADPAKTSAPTYTTPGAPARYAPSSNLNNPPQRDTLPANNNSPQQYEAYNTPSIVTRAASLAISSPEESRAARQQRGMDYHNGDTDGDMPMEDADPYNKQKYAARPLSNAGGYAQQQNNRLSTQYLPQDDGTGSQSRAAARYSPMNTSPASPGYMGSPPQQHSAQMGGYTSYTPHQSARASPTRQNQYTSPTQQRFYASPPSSSRAHSSQLPPLQSNMSPSGASYFPQSATQQLNAVFGQEPPRSPLNQQREQLPPGDKGPVPQFTKTQPGADLQARVNRQPPFRRANPEGGFISPLQALTTHLPATYRICNPSFQYESSRNPRRVLTKPSKGVKNDGYDNEESDYILYVNDILGSEETNHKNRYLILDVLGQGTFGQVVKCQNLKTQEVVAVKVVKNKTAYFNQSMMEVSVLDLLNGRMDKNDDHHILRLKDTFIHRQHLCLVFELLSVNLYELIKQNQFRGLSTTLVRVFAQQLLNGLCLLNKARLIHCDLKPENILLKNLESPIIKIIDFGSACDERQTVYTYIQSRFYRSPEVLMGLPYSAAIDMWSLGCIVVELFLGLPLFPGSSEYNQVSRITEMLGLPPNWMLENGKQSGEFFERVTDEFGRRGWRLKSMDQYSREHGTKEQPSKKYFSSTRLPEIIRTYPMPRKGMKQNEIEREMANREAFIDFTHGLLNINPLERWSPQQARTHPFITQQKYTGPFQPQMNLKATSRSPAPGVQQQQQAEVMSKQRAQAQQQQQAAAAQQAAATYGMSPAYPASPAHQQQMYQNMYSPHQTQSAAPPPYPANPPSTYAQPPMSAAPMIQQPPPAAASMNPYQQQPAPPNLYTQATTRAGRQRASTLDGGPNGTGGGIPPALQRVVSHLDPNAPIRLQPSPAYYPPPPEGSEVNSIGNIGGRRRTSRARQPGNLQQDQRNFIRVLEDRTLEEGWHGGGGGAAGGTGGSGWGGV